MSNQDDDECGKCTRPKVPKLNDLAMESGLTTIAVERQESVIFKLDTVIRDKLFEYLSLDDLCALGQTCRRLNRSTGLYFQENFGKESSRIYKWRDSKRILFNRNDLDVSVFSHFIEAINIGRGEKKALQYIESNCSSVRKMMVIDRFGELTVNSINCLKQTLARVDHVDFHDNCDNPICESILQLCTNIKCLTLSYTSLSNYWFLQKHPLLESVSFAMGSNNDVDLKTFLELNPNIDRLEIDAELLMKEGESLRTTHATLHELSVSCHYFGDVDSLIILLNSLHQQGFFKRLSVTFSNLHAGNAPLLHKLRTLDKLFLGYFDENISLSIITTLKKVNFDAQAHVNIDVEKLIASAGNLESIIVFEPRMEQLVLMMQSLPNLKEILATHHEQSNTIDNNVLDLAALNEAREQLIGPRQVNIYLTECVFLPTRWKFGHRRFNLVEIRRIGSITK